MALNGFPLLIKANRVEDWEFMLTVQSSFFFFFFLFRFMPRWWIGELHEGNHHFSAHLGEMGFPSVQPVSISDFWQECQMSQKNPFECGFILTKRRLIVNTSRSSDGWRMKGNQSSVYDLHSWHSTKASGPFPLWSVLIGAIMHARRLWEQYFSWNR